MTIQISAKTHPIFINSKLVNRALPPIMYYVWYAVHKKRKEMAFIEGEINNRSNTNASSAANNIKASHHPQMWYNNAFLFVHIIVCGLKAWSQLVQIRSTLKPRCLVANMYNA